jgi:hypothetical protein
MLQLFHESSEEIHIDIPADFVKDEPVAKVAPHQNVLDGSASFFVICVANTS